MSKFFEGSQNDETKDPRQAAIDELEPLIRKIATARTSAGMEVTKSHLMGLSDPMNVMQDVIALVEGNSNGGLLDIYKGVGVNEDGDKGQDSKEEYYDDEVVEKKKGKEDEEDEKDLPLKLENVLELTINLLASIMKMAMEEKEEVGMEDVMDMMGNMRNVNKDALDKGANLDEAKAFEDLERQAEGMKGKKVNSKELKKVLDKVEQDEGRELTGQDYLNGMKTIINSRGKNLDNVNEKNDGFSMKTNKDGSGTVDLSPDMMKQLTEGLKGIKGMETVQPGEVNDTVLGFDGKGGAGKGGMTPGA